jgi:hypothetical protein
MLYFINQSGWVMLVLTIIFFGLGFFIRLNEMITIVEYYHGQESYGQSYYVSSSLQKMDKEFSGEAIDVVSGWLKKNNFSVNEARHIYINEIRGDFVSAMFCSEAIDNHNSNCSSLIVKGYLKNDIKDK